MRIRLEAQGRPKTPASGPFSALLAVLALALVAGCGARHSEQTPAESQSQGESPAQTMLAAITPEPGAQILRSKPAGPVHRITLSDRRCIQFEPQWTRVRVGESVTWHSELKSPMTIYVSPGVFSRVSFLVRPGATVSTGPARAVGRFSFWTEPSACLDMPRGVLLSGPGVNVEETYYASNSGSR
jgi:plastocyanin